jgi:sugar porter (SP) family MFS transporter
MINRALFIATFIASLGGLLFGFDIAVVTGAMPFLATEFQLSSGMQGLTLNLTLIGSAFGVLIIGRPSDFLGRRRMMMVIALLFLFSAIATGVISNFKFFLVFRFITGIAIGGSAVLVPVYISELSPPNIRGRLVATFQLAITIGILMAFLSDYMLMDTGANNWRYMFIFRGFPALIFYLLLIFVPESPRYLMQRGLEHESDVVIRRTNPNVDKNEFIKEFKKFNNIKILVSNAYLFKQPYLKLLYLGIALGMFNQFTGINAVMYYTTDLFRSFVFAANSGIEQALIIGLTALVFTIVAMTKIDKVGRKKLLLVGSIGMTVCLSLFAILFMAGFKGSYIMLPVLIGFTGFCAASQGTVIWVLLSEMFPNNIRIRGVSIGIFSYLSFNVVTSFILPVISPNYGVGSLFAFYAFATFGSFFFYRKYLIETKGKTLEEIEKDMKKESVFP